MNCVLPSIVLISCALLPLCFAAYNTQHEWEIKKFRAVTSFNELLNFYRRFRQKIADHSARPQEATDPQKRRHIKKDICKNIFTSPYFERLSEQWVDVELNTVRQKLRNDYSLIYNTIFRTPEPGQRTDAGSHEYRNPYQFKLTAYTDPNGEPAYENVFLCLVSESATGVGSDVYKGYYVSREYNVNSVEHAFPIVGRFIFSVNSLQQLELEALAEESAISWEFQRRLKLIETLYLWKRNNFRLVANPRLDPVCSLSEVDKVRLCAIFFGTPIFEKSGIKFLPYSSNVQMNCERKRVRIRTPVFAPVIRIATRAIMNQHRNNDEWVIGCHAGGRHPKTYFLAQGTHHNTIFAFNVPRRHEPMENQPLSVFGFFDNVSVVGDSDTATIESAERSRRMETMSNRGGTSLRRTEMAPDQIGTESRWEFN